MMIIRNLSILKAPYLLKKEYFFSLIIVSFIAITGKLSIWQYHRYLEKKDIEAQLIITNPSENSPLYGIMKIEPSYFGSVLYSIKSLSSKKSACYLLYERSFNNRVLVHLGFAEKCFIPEEINKISQLRIIPYQENRLVSFFTNKLSDELSKDSFTLDQLILHNPELNDIKTDLFLVNEDLVPGYLPVNYKLNISSSRHFAYCIQWMAINFFLILMSINLYLNINKKPKL